MKRFLSLMVLLFLLLPMTAACVKNESSTKSNTVDSNGSGDDYLDNLPERDYKGADFRILVPTQTSDFYLSKDNGDMISEAAVFRNALVEKKYNVSLKYTDIDGNKTGATAFTQVIRTAHEAGGLDSYDLIVGQTYYVISLALEGMLANLNNSEFLHFDKDWYSSKINNNGIINGKMYGASGSYIMSQISYAMGIYFNKQFLADAHGDVNLYELVENKQWTFEKLKQLSTNYYLDVNNDGNYDDDDRYGLVCHIHSANALLVGSDLPIATRTGEGITLLNYYGPRLLEVFSAYFTYYNNKNNVKAFPLDFDPVEKLAAGKALFASAQVGAMNDSVVLRNSPYTYGILPNPLYDENQEEYFTYTMRWELFYVPQTADFERSAIVLEYLNYTSEQQLIPEYWDKALNRKLVDVLEDSNMLYIIRDNLYYDFATFQHHELLSIRDAVASRLKSGNERLSSWWGDGMQFENALATLIEKYNALP